MTERLRMALVLETDTPERFELAVNEAVARLGKGEVVVLPTETVYGLAANALYPPAVARIFEVKGRPATNPIIVHVAGVDMARTCASEWPERADELAAAFWPGPLTLVLRKSARVPDIVTAGGPTVGLRWPRHSVIETVIRRSGFPLAAPSANLSGEVSPTLARHAQRSLGERVNLIVDGGPADVGIESTVLDLTVSPPRVLRPGMVQIEALAAVVGPVRDEAIVEPGVLRSPGLLLRHYAPHARLVLWNPAEGRDIEAVLPELGVPRRTIFVLGLQEAPGREWGATFIMPREPAAYARALYSTLHRCDAAGARVILVEAVPDTPDWRGVADRLRRAAA